jgi:hypothetical protein
LRDFVLAFLFRFGRSKRRFANIAKINTVNPKPNRISKHTKKRTEPSTATMSPYPTVAMVTVLKYRADQMSSGTLNEFGSAFERIR